MNDNGDIYVKLRSAYPDGGNVALRDEDNDGKADIIKIFGLHRFVWLWYCNAHA